MLLGRFRGNIVRRYFRDTGHELQYKANMIGEIHSLHPVFRNAVDHILKDMKAKGHDAVIGSGMRTNEEQDALYAQGRKGLKEVNALRVQNKLPPITADENTISVTNARGGQSNHNKAEYMLAYSRGAIDVATGYAVDIVDKRLGWKATSKFWTDLGELAEKYGCEWGGNWKKPDVAHVQMKIIEGAPRTSVIV